MITLTFFGSHSVPDFSKFLTNFTSVTTWQMSFWTVEELYIFKLLLWACLCTLLTLAVFFLTAFNTHVCKATTWCGKHWTRNQTWPEVPLPILSNSMTLGKSCNLFNPQFPCQSMDKNFHIYLIGLSGVPDEEKLLNNFSILLSSVIKTVSLKCWMDSFGWHCSVTAWSFNLSVFKGWTDLD